jgi:hypothetical protein
LLDLAKEAGASNPAHLARQLMLLYDGAAISAWMDHNASAPTAARSVATALVDAATPPAKRRDRRNLFWPRERTSPSQSKPGTPNSKQSDRLNGVPAARPNGRPPRCRPLPIVLVNNLRYTLTAIALIHARNNWRTPVEDEILSA